MESYCTNQTKAWLNRLSVYSLEADFCSITMEPIDPVRFQARAMVAELPPLSLARVDSAAAICTRKPDPRPSKRFSFAFAIEGEGIISHYLGATDLQKGDFLLLDNSHPRKLFIYNQLDMFLLTVSDEMLRKYIPCPEEVLGSRMRCDAPGHQALCTRLLAVWEQLKKGMPGEFAPVIASNLLQRISQAYANYYPNKESRQLRRVRKVLELIEENLDNPDLTVGMLAERLGISSRYLRLLFAGSEKISQYILRRRLEECASQLSNALYQNVSITSIAFRCGFNSPAHFSRAFKQHFGSTPREYRKRQLDRPPMPIQETKFVAGKEHPLQ